MGNASGSGAEDSIAGDERAGNERRVPKLHSLALHPGGAPINLPTLPLFGMNAFALAEATTLPAMWDQLYRHVSPEAVVAEVLQGERVVTLTYKELNARAHCLAAYLLAKGLRAGDRVALIADAHPQLLPLDLAIQLAGGISVVIGGAQRAPRVRALLDAAQPRVVLVAALDTYRQLQHAIDGYAAHGGDPLSPASEVIVAAASGDELVEADRATHLERAIELGKVSWREQTEHLRGAKAAVATEAPAVWFAAERGAVAFTALTQGQVIAAARAVAQGLPQLSTADRVLVLAGYDQTLGRLAATTALAAGLPWLSADRFARALVAVSRLRPTVVVALPRIVNWLTHRLTPTRGLAGRYWGRALAVSRRLEALAAEQQPQPVGLRLAHRLAQAWFYQPIRKKKLASVQQLLTLAPGLRPEAEHVLRQLELPALTHLGAAPLDRLVTPAPVAATTPVR